MTQTKTATLKVPGANLYYEVTGSGPVLLMIPGAPADAGAFGAIAGQLADRYTVVSYDWRGSARSPLDEPAGDLPIHVQGDDAGHLLTAVADGPAYVLGCSGGALTGLDLAARRPELVDTLVAHEPPAMNLLPDAAGWRTAFQQVYETYRREGAGPARRAAGSPDARHVTDAPRDGRGDGPHAGQLRSLPRPPAAGRHRPHPRCCRVARGPAADRRGRRGGLRRPDASPGRPGFGRAPWHHAGQLPRRSHGLCHPSPEVRRDGPPCTSRKLTSPPGHRPPEPLDRVRRGAPASYSVADLLVMPTRKRSVS